MKNLCKFIHKIKFSIQIRHLSSERMYENSSDNVRNFTIFAPSKDVQGMKVLNRKMFE